MPAPVAGATATASRGTGFASKLTDCLQARNSANLSRPELLSTARNLASLRSASGQPRADLGRLEPARAASYRALLQSSPDLQIAWDGDTPVFMTGLNAASADFLHTTGGLLHLEQAAAEMQLTRSQTDELGQTHLRYQQVFEGHDVWGCEAIVHVLANGRVGAFNGRLAPTPRTLHGVTPRIDGAAAEHLAAAPRPSAARAHAEALEIYAPAGTAPRLVWRVRVEIALDDIHDVFVDALNGEIVHRVSRVETDGPVTGSGVDLLGQTRTLNLFQQGTTLFNINTAKRMFDPTSSIPQTVRGGIRILDAQHGQGQDLFFSTSTSATNWSGKAADVSAAANASIVYDYFDQRHGRNSINGNGGSMEIIVNFQNSFNNAFWNGQFMIFGNGDGNAFSDLAAAFDVTAHEMTHGVVENTANLIYETQSGALNESFADVFGTCAEFFANPGSANFLLGEDVTTPNIAGDCLRNMEDPAAANVAFNGQQPTRMSEFRNLPNDDQNDHGGVHTNSGITNRAFFLIATHGALGATASERLGKAERIYYRALANYLTRSSQFIDCRLAVIRAAGDLFGGPSGAVATACGSAFDTVEITNGTPSEPPPTLPPVTGQDWIAATSAADGRLYRLDPDNASTVQPISSIPIWNKASLTDDGSTALYIGSDHRLYAAATDATNERVVSSAAVWRSIALSPDGNLLAATSTATDDTIYVLDLQAGAAAAYPIRAQNYGGEGDAAAQFADFLDFSNDGQFVLYDAFNVKNTAGNVFGYWDINVMRVADGSTLRVFPPQEAGVDIGNPTFSSTSDFVIAFDYVAPNGGVTVLGANLEQGTIGTITVNGGAPGRPSFSPDAHRVAYQYFDDTTPLILVTVTLAADGITGVGDDAALIGGGFDAVWFAIGTRTAVTLSALSAALEGDAAHLEWEASADAEHDYFRVLRDAGAGFEPRSGPLREPQSRGRNSDRWMFRDVITDLPRHVESVHYAVEAVSAAGEHRILATVELRLDEVADAPRPVRLLPNVPNPFNPQTAIPFVLGRRQRIDLGVYDAGGRRLRTLWSGIAEAGSHVRLWDGRDDGGVPQASGIYFARLVTADGTRTQKMTMVK